MPSRQKRQPGDALISAAAARQRKTVRRLLDSGVDPNYYCGTPYKSPALIGAFRIGAGIPMDLVELLLDRGADPNRADWERNTPLTVAAARGDEALKLADTLIARGAHLNPGISQVSETPLNAAISTPCPSAKLAKFLIETGADVHAPGHLGRTPLGCAAIHGDLKTARLLLDHGADIHAGDDHDWTALHHAAYFNQKNVAHELIQRGADPSLRNAEGKTPVDLAIARGEAEIVQAVQNPAAGQKTRKRNELAARLTKLITLRKQRQACKLLAEVSAKMRRRDLNKAFGPAVAGGLTAVARALLQVGARPKPDELNQRLAQAIANHRPPASGVMLIRLLLDAGAYINAVIGDDNQQPAYTPLMQACGYFDSYDDRAPRNQNRRRLIELMLRLGADAGYRSHRGDSAANTAILVCDEPSVATILNKTPDPLILKDGAKWIDLARLRKKPKIADRIKSALAMAQHRAASA